MEVESDFAVYSIQTKIEREERKETLKICGYLNLKPGLVMQSIGEKEGMLHPAFGKR